MQNGQVNSHIVTTESSVRKMKTTHLYELSAYSNEILNGMSKHIIYAGIHYSCVHSPHRVMGDDNEVKNSCVAHLSG